MLILLHGQDNFRSRRKLNEAVERYKKGRQSQGLDLQYLEGEGLNYQKFKDQFFSKTIFKGKKLLVVTGAFLNKKFKEEFLKEAGQFVNDTVLFYESEAVPENDPLVRFLKKKGRVIQFRSLEGQKLKDWAKKEFENRHSQIEPRAMERLVNDIGNDLWRFSNEIEKLVCYKKRGRIELKDVELLIEPRLDVNIFRTVDFLASGDKKRALRLIHQHLGKGDSPSYLLAMIVYQFRNLLLVKSCQSGESGSGGYYLSPAKKLNLHPYVLKKTWGQAERFDLEQLKKIYRKIFQVDLKMKTGQLNPQAALDFLIAEI